MVRKYKYLSKIKSIEQMLNIRRELFEKGKTLVFTNGCYDLLHPGHIRLLHMAGELGDYLLVAVNSDASVKRLKGNSRPILHLDARMEVLCALASVNGIIPFDEDIPLKLIEMLKPEVYVKGRGYRRVDIPEADLVESYGGKVVLLPQLSDHSTTGIIEKIRSLSTY